MILDASGNPQAIDIQNSLPVLSEGTKATYSVLVPDFGLAAGATDFLTIVGSATKTIRITCVSIEGDATAAAMADVYLYKRTAANTGGTATQPAIVKHDSSDQNPTAVVNLYSVNPTALGAGVLVRGGRLGLPAHAAAAYAFDRVWDFAGRNSKSLVLRGVGQSLAFNFGGAAVPAGTSLYVKIEWTEE